MGYKKAKVKKKYIFECEECGFIQERTKNIKPPLCPKCEQTAKDEEEEKRRRQAWSDIGNFKKKNDFRESKCCSNCKNADCESGWDDEYTWRCLGAGITEFGDKTSFLVDPTNCCDAYDK